LRFQTTGEPLETNPLVPSEIPSISKDPNLEVLSVISRSIFLQQATSIEYLSRSKGPSRREIVPFALADCEYGWVVRAYDRLSDQFRNFDLARISVAAIITGRIRVEETQAKDIQWNRYVELELVPHPTNVGHPKVVEAEFKMSAGMNKVWVRAPLVAYTLHRWNVDCSERHTLKGSEYQLWLRNRQTLYGVSNLSLAPGYEAKPSR
jgi:predicted DNA-binding transcriptional regulator YafY